MDKNESTSYASPERRTFTHTVKRIIDVAASKGVTLSNADIAAKLNISPEKFEEDYEADFADDQVFEQLKENFGEFLPGGFVVEQVITMEFLHYPEEPEDFEIVDDDDPDNE